MVFNTEKSLSSTTRSARFPISKTPISVSHTDFAGVNVGLIDERSEIAACYQGIPTNDVGLLTDVYDSCPKDKGILICVARKSEVSGIIKIIKSADDKTFIIVSEANEILGEGFKHSI